MNRSRATAKTRKGSGRSIRLEAVNSLGVPTDNHPLFIFGNVLEGAFDNLPGVGESALVMGIITAP